MCLLLQHCCRAQIASLALPLHLLLLLWGSCVLKYSNAPILIPLLLLLLW
jgi:hypothetical protein